MGPADHFANRVRSAAAARGLTMVKLDQPPAGAQFGEADVRNLNNAPTAARQMTAEAATASFDPPLTMTVRTLRPDERS